jgi:hypothetical protein
MRRVLIVSPHFPPVNAPDMQRVRMSLPYFAENGWHAWVLTVGPEWQEDSPKDTELLSLLPSDVAVEATAAWPLHLSRRLGIGNVGLRAFGRLYRAGARLIRDHHIDLVYFSTTMFLTLPLGRLWKRRLGIPYVIDFQDPWHSTYYDGKPAAERPPKYAFASRLHATLEPWTMRTVDGVVSVSPAYVDTLRRRYPWIRADRCAVVPFGASEHDFEVAARRPPSAEAVQVCSERPAAVSLGRGGADLATALRILFRSVRAAAEAEPVVAGLRMAFVGTDYAPVAAAKKSIEPVALEEGVAGQVVETTSRIAYLASLDVMRRADLLLLIGSDDPQYSASKVYPYLLARKPIVAVLHEGSPLVELLRRAHSGPVVTFRHRDDLAGPVEHLTRELRYLVPRLPFEPSVEPSMIAACSARTLTRRQCDLFDAVLEPQRAAAVLPCPG